MILKGFSVFGITLAFIFSTLTAAYAVVDWDGTGAGSNQKNNCKAGKVESSKDWDKFARNVDGKKCREGSYLNFGMDDDDDDRVIGKNLASQKARKCENHKDDDGFRIFWLTQDGSSDQWLYSTRKNTRDKFEEAVEQRDDLTPEAIKEIERQYEDGKNNTIVCVWLDD